MRYIILLILSFPTCEFLSAQSLSTVDYLGIDQGLSNNSVSCIYKDRRGLMWFGTYDGLNRYDGYDFKIFRRKQGDSSSIVNNWISCIVEDSLGSLWIGTRNGVSQYDPVHDNFRLVSYLTSDEKALHYINGGINDVRTDAHGTVFIASAMHGLLICRKGETIARQIKGFDADQAMVSYDASSISFAPGGDIYITVRGKGLFRTNAAGMVLSKVNPLPANALCSQVDKNNHVWIGADNGLYEFDPAHSVLRQVYQSDNRIVQLSLEQNSLWIASDGDGVLIKNIDSGAVQSMTQGGDRSPITSPSVYAIYHDNDRRIWIGTIRGGINIVDKRKSRFIALTHDPLDHNSLVNNYVLSSCEDMSGNIWVGTDGGGLSCYNRKENLFTNYVSQRGKKSLSNNFVTTLLNDDQNNIWIGTWGGGVDRFNQRTHQFQHYPCLHAGTVQEDKNIWSLYQDKEKTIWAGACVSGPLYRFNNTSDRFEAFDTTLRNIVTLYEDREGQLWGGDYYSLIKIDRIHKKHTRLPIGFTVRSMYEDEQGRFWIATEGNGLLLFNKKTGQFKTYTEEDGLANNAVLQILPDGKGDLWLSTFKGISVFSAGTGRFHNILQSDGLLSNQLSYHAALALQSGEFLFGGIKGLNIFYPGKMDELHQPHRILLSNISIDNTTPDKSNTYIAWSDRKESIRLPFDKAVLSLTFVTPEYSTPDKINYAYYLEGWDKDWNYSGKNRTVAYTRLHEGSYLFKVKVADAYNNWSAAESLVSIVVLPPWYRTWWAYLLYTLAAGALIYILLRYRSRQIKLQYEVAYARNEMEREKELNERKLSFFTNVAHEFRSPLTLIVGPVKELIPRFQHTPEAKELNTVYRNAKRLLSLVNQLLLFRKADAEEDRLIVQRINLYELCGEVYTCFWQQARVKNIQYELNCPALDVEVYGDYEKLEIVLFNLISNALKYTPDGGRVSITVEEKEHLVDVVIEDTGCGIDPTEGQDVFRKFYQAKHRNGRSGFGIGLYLSQKFTLAHKGRLWYKSEPAKGSLFCLSLQKGMSHIKEWWPDQVMEGKPQLIEELSEAFAEPAGLFAGDPLSDEKGGVFAADGGSIAEEVFNDRKTVFVVDDDEEVRRYLKQILSEKYIVKEACDGETAFEMIQRQVPDLIISDIVMRQMDGIELCRKIKEHPELTHTPVILLTSSSSDDVKLNGIRFGADDFITKPFDRTFLLARIDNIFKSRNTLQQYFLDTITLQKGSAGVSSEYRVFLQQCIQIVETYIDKDDFSIKILAKEIGMSHSSLYKKIKLISGVSASSFIRFIRLRRAAVLMLTTNANVNEAAFQVGINDPKYFREQFKKLFGMNPSEYIRQYRHSFNSNISLATGPDPGH